MSHYEIADVVMEITTDNQYILEHLKSFISSTASPSDMIMNILPAEAISIPDGECVFSEMMSWVRKIPEGSGYFGYCESDRHNAFVAIDSDPEWKNIELYYVENAFENKEFEKELNTFYALFAGTALANHVILKNGIVLHASCISYNGKGIAFTAPSGTGKSTHTQLWEKYKPGTIVLNDDTPVLRFLDNKPVLYGTPWSGSQFKNQNAMAPLSAIVILEQAAESSVRQVNPKEAVAGLMPRLLLPYYDRTLMDLAIKTLDDIIAQVPVYHLKCRPDAEAVELVHQCIK